VGGETVGLGCTRQSGDACLTDLRQSRDSRRAWRLRAQKIPTNDDHLYNSNYLIFYLQPVLA
jgi:hypothetical protein